MEPFERKIKYESQLRKDFAHLVAQAAWGKEILDCIQCGACSGICPTSPYMDHPPRRIMAMIREGMKEEVLQSFTIWLCSSCYACMVHCPQGIKITEIMYGLKRMAIEGKVFPQRFPIATLAQDFFSLAQKKGRIPEFWLAFKLMLKTGWRKSFSYLPMGLDLMKAGRITLKTEKITAEGKKQIQVLLESREGDK